MWRNSRDRTKRNVPLGTRLFITHFILPGTRMVLLNSVFTFDHVYLAGQAHFGKTKEKCNHTFAPATLCNAFQVTALKKNISKH